jgi:hypothetical protein
MKYLIVLIAATAISLPLIASDLKTTDLNNQQLNTTQNITDKETISPKQMEELQKNMETIKENQKKSDVMLKELDKEL